MFFGKIALGLRAVRAAGTDDKEGIMFMINTEPPNILISV